MILYIIRHAIAEPAGRSENEDDSRRPLTPKGRRKMHQIALGLKELEVQIDLLLSSPYLRASQTARILGKTLGIRSERVALSDNLMPGAYADRLVHEINLIYAGCENIALIGHEPSLSSLISMLISGDPTLFVTLKKGGVCKLSLEALRYGRCATLEWLLAPSQLVEIGA